MTEVHLRGLEAAAEELLQHHRELQALSMELTALRMSLGLQKGLGGTAALARVQASVAGQANGMAQLRGALVRTAQCWQQADRAACDNLEGAPRWRPVGYGPWETGYLAPFMQDILLR